MIFYYLRKVNMKKKTNKTSQLLASSTIVVAVIGLAAGFALGRRGNKSGSEECLDKTTCEANARKGYRKETECVDEATVTKKAREGYVLESLCSDSKVDEKSCGEMGFIDKSKCPTTDEKADENSCGALGFINKSECPANEEVDMTKFVAKSVVESDYTLNSKIPKPEKCDKYKKRIDDLKIGLGTGLALSGGLTLAVMIMMYLRRRRD